MCEVTVSPDPANSTVGGGEVNHFLPLQDGKVKFHCMLCQEEKVLLQDVRGVQGAGVNRVEVVRTTDTGWLMSQVRAQRETLSLDCRKTSVMFLSYQICRIILVSKVPGDQGDFMYISKYSLFAGI